MASSSDEQPTPPEPPAAAAAVVAAAVPPQTHAEWAASLQAYYAAAGHHPYAWPAQVRFWPFGRGEGKPVVRGSD
jgi:plant G-box-binding factor